MNSHYTPFDLPIRISYVPPGWLGPFIYITHLWAGICLIWVNLTLIWMTLLILMVISSLLVHGHRHRRFMQYGLPVSLMLNAKDEWAVINADGKRSRASLSSAVILQPTFIVLVLKTEDNKYVFILTAENVDRHTLRRLRVRLYYPRRAG